MGGLELADRLGPVKANIPPICREIIRAAAARGLPQFSTLYGYSASSVPEHSAGLAVDFMVYTPDGRSYNNNLGDFAADYVWANRDRLGLRWQIWRQRVRSTTPGKPPYWVAMADRGSATQNHYDHVHMFFWEKPYVAPANQPPPEEDDLTYSREELVDIINSTVINVFRSPEAKGIIKQEAINALNLPVGRQGLGENAGETSPLSVAAWFDAHMDGLNRRLAGVDAKSDAALAALAQIANDPDVSLDAIKQAVQEAVANSVQVTGTLEVTSKAVETPVVPEAQEPQS